MSVVILYTDYSYCICESILENYTDILPQQVIEKASAFRKWQDRQAFLLGRLLIWKGLKSFNYEDNCLTRLQINNYGKPYLDRHIFFNVSHSGKYVMCAFDKEAIGIDIEEIQRVQIEEFNAILSEKEKDQLRNACNPTEQFYKLWTIKESVIKAEGKGLFIPMDQVTISQEGTVSYGKKVWYVKEVDNFEKYCCVIATTTKLTSLIIKKVNFELACSTETVVTLV